METTTNNLGTFRILFIVKGVLNLLISLIFIVYVGFGAVLMNVNEPEFHEFNPGIIVIIFGGIGVLLTVAFGVVTLLAGKYIAEARNYNFILVVAVLNCLSGVLGILLGVFTIIELNKPHVKALFDRNLPARAA